MLLKSKLNFESCDKKDQETVFSFKNSDGFECLYRNETDQLYKKLGQLKEKTYKYWEVHLVLDFIYSMSLALDACTSEYLLWLDDDTVVTDNFQSSFEKVKNNMNTIDFYHGTGFCCQLFTRSFLVKFINTAKEMKK